MFKPVPKILAQEVGKEILYSDFILSHVLCIEVIILLG